MATTIQLRKLNRNNVYRSLLRDEKTSIKMIADRLGLSFPTVSQIIDDLTQKGLIEVTGVYKSTGGRKAQIITSIPDARVSLGVDITKNHINIVMLDLAYNILGSVRERIPFRMDEPYFETLSNMVRSVVGTYRERVLGVTVSIPAIVIDDGTKITYAPLLEGGTGLCEKMKQYIPYPIRAMNDANAGAYSELSKGQENRSFTYLMLSNTVGGAHIVDGKIRVGDRFRGGEFGHMTLVPDGGQCYCGQKGCVDVYCSALRLSSNLEEFFENLEKGDRECRKKWEEYLYYLAIVLNNLQISTNCEVMIGGYVGWFIQPYMDEVRKAVRERCSFPDEINISVCSTDTEASAKGAAMIYIDRFLETV